MSENKILVSDIINELNKGNRLDYISGIELTNYLPMATKKILAEEVIKNSIEIIDGMKVVNPITKYISINLSIVHFYTNIEGDFDDMCKHGIVDYIVKKIQQEYCLILDFVEEMMLSEIETYNSLSGVLNRNLEKLINKIPETKDMEKLLKKLPKTLDSLSPESREMLKGFLEGKIK